MGAGDERAPEVVALALSAARELKHALTDATEASAELPAKGGAPIVASLKRAELDRLILPAKASG